MQTTPETVSPDPARRAEPEPRATARGSPHHGRLYLVLMLVYVAFVVYGSLVPLEFKSIPFDRAVETFRRMPFLHMAIRSRADLLANVLLFIPLTFLAMGALTRENRRRGRWLIAAAVVVAASALSVAVEFAQVYFPRRTVSQNDIIAETAGGLLGVVLWFNCGHRITRWARSLWQQRTDNRMAARILLGYLVFIVLYLLFPFDLTISFREVYHKLKSARVTAVPFTDVGDAWLYAALSKAAVMAPVGYFLLLLRPRPGRLGLLAAAAAGLVFAAAVEAAQVFTYSRCASTTDLFYGTAGILAGAAAATRFGPAAERSALDSPFWARHGWWIKLAAAAGWIGGAAWQKCRPFDFALPPGGLARAVGRIFAVPLSRQYGLAEVQAGAQIVREFTTAFVMAMLVRGLLAPATRAGRAAACALVLFIAAALEVAQVFLPSRTPDLTAICIALAAAALGFRAMPGFVNVFLKTDPPAAPAPAGPDRGREGTGQ